jgi:hypothetical protein
MKFKTTRYFEYVRVRPDRVNIKDAWIRRALEHPIRVEIQSDEEFENGRIYLKSINFSV